MKRKFRKTVQFGYLIIFLITAIGISGNIELDLKIPIYCWITFGISGFLTIGKIIYCKIYYPNKIYYWN